MKKRLLAIGVAAPLIFGFGLAGTAMATPGTLDTCIPSEGSTTEEETGWLTAPPDGDGWEVIETQTVVDVEEETLTEFLVAFYQQTDWVLAAPEGEGWVQIEERTVIDQEYVPGEYEQTDWVTESPGEGWTQIAERWVVDVEAQPAQGTPTIVIPNPDYVPGWTETIEHPAEYVTVHHEAEYKTLWKYTKHGGHGFIWVDNDDYKYIVDGVGTNDKPEWWEFKTFYERTQHTKQELVKEAYDEQVLVKDAWTETIEHPAQGEETIEVTNPDYVPAVEEQGHWEYKFARHVPAIPEESHQEYKFAKHIPGEWMTEVPEGDGWKVKDERTTVITEEESHEEYRYSRTIVIDPVECPATPEQPEPETPDTPDSEEPVEEEEPTNTPQARQRTVTPQAEAQAEVQAEVDELAHTGAEQHTGAITLAALMALAGGSLTAIRHRLARR